MALSIPSSGSPEQAHEQPGDTHLDRLSVYPFFGLLNGIYAIL